MANPNINALKMQDVFLNEARRTKTAVTLVLVNGREVNGTVKAFDAFTVLLESEGTQTLIYKHSIVTVTPAAPLKISLDGKDGKEGKKDKAE